MKFTRTKCKCDECPLNGMKKVRAGLDAEKFSVAIVGDAVGPREAESGEMFVGAEGSKLKEVISSAGLIWHLVWKTRVVVCDLDSIGGLDDVEGKLAYECCLPGFEEEVEFLEKSGVKVLVPMGQAAMNAMGIEGKIGKYRGSVFPRKKAVVVPTYEYEFYRNGMWKEELTWMNDFQKVWDLSLKKYVKPKEKFNLFPKEGDVIDFVDNAIEEDLLVAVDIETTSLNPYYSKILMIGLAVNGEECLVVPFTKQGGSSYWAMGEESRVSKALKRLFAEARTMFHNAPFDTWHLEVHGYPVKRLSEDTMLLHHSLNPELKHNLGYVVSVYGKTPYWKEVVLGSETKMIGMEDKEVRTYNARDTVVLHQVRPGMKKHLKEVGTEKVYREVSLPLVKALRNMSMAGLPVDQKKLAKLKVEFVKRAKEAEEKIRKEWNLGAGFNLKSGDHMRMLVLGKKPAGYQAVMDEMDKYEKDKKKRRDTKKYETLKERFEVFNETEGMYLPNTYSAPRELKLDGEEFINIQKAAIKRLDAIDGLVRKTKAHEEEKDKIERLIGFVKDYREFVDMNKLATTFTGFPIGPDGRVHPSYKIHGTATGRLSSAEPNAQNFAEEVLGIFSPGNGRVIVKADYSNIELRVLGYLAKEKVIIEAFESGQNIHDVNTKLLFGIEKDDENWHTARKAAKIYVFGRTYGGSVEGIYKQILAKVPELRLGLPYFKKMDKAYFDKLGNYKEWCRKTIEVARKTRVSENAFGRKRFLLGTPDEIERQALNSPVQGTAGEIAERAIITLDEVLSKKIKNAPLIGTVHDSILVECDEKDKMKVAKIMKEVMEKTIWINGYEGKFPVDIEIGKSWGETEKV